MKRMMALVLAMAMLLGVAVLGGCREEVPSQTVPPVAITPNANGATTTVAGETATTTQVAQPFYKSDEEVFLIDTPYVQLQYPVRWQDRVTAIGNDSEPYIVSFKTTLSIGEVPLFDIVFGECDGYKLGAIEVNGQSIDIYIRHYELSPDDVPQEEYYEWGGMCEDVNTLISGLVYNYNMIIQ